MKILITAGPTREAIDPVRFISNKSSGKMGYAIADVAAKRGHKVKLISGPVCLNVPRNVNAIRVVTAMEMLRAVEENFSWADVLIMAAAVADWRPSKVFSEKIKKRMKVRSIQLIRNPDILRKICHVKGNKIVVGFAAETRNLIKEATRKLKEKKLDMIVANDVSESRSGFEVDYNRGVLIFPDGTLKTLPVMLKKKMAFIILKEVERLYKQKAQK